MEEERNGQAPIGHLQAPPGATKLSTKCSARQSPTPATKWAGREGGGEWGFECTATTGQAPPHRRLLLLSIVSTTLGSNPSDFAFGYHVRRCHEQHPCACSGLHCATLRVLGGHGRWTLGLGHEVGSNSGSHCYCSYRTGAREPLIELDHAMQHAGAQLLLL